MAATSGAQLLEAAGLQESNQFSPGHRILYMNRTLGSVGRVRRTSSGAVALPCGVGIADGLAAGPFSHGHHEVTGDL